MTVLLRSFIVWLMLLALPYQGYASAAMMLCAPVPATAAKSAQSAASAQYHMGMPAGPHDHAVMLAAMRDASHVGSHDASDDAAQHHAATSGDTAAPSDTGHPDHAHGGIKCGGAACCVAGAPMMTLAIAVPVLPAVSSVVPSYSQVLHAVDLAHPERPPQGNFV
jgi:hypothetical protein